jgi:hypothetical protein
MNVHQFNQLPYLLRRGRVCECGFAEFIVRSLARDGALQPIDAGGHHFYYRRSELAPFLGYVMDWRPFDQLGCLIHSGDLVRAGLQRRDINRLVENGLLGVVNHDVPRRCFYKFDLATLVGRCDGATVAGAAVRR